MKKIHTVLTIAIVLMLIGATFIACAGRKTNPIVLSPETSIEGLKYSEWLAKWWQYALMLPAAQNPLSGETGENCVFQRIGNVGLVLANSTLSVPINCEVPSGMMLYVEVLGAECSTLEEPPFYGGDEDELIACAQAFIPQDLEASIDGIEIENLSKYLITSPLYEITEPEDNILAVPAGTTGKSVGSGIYLMIAPLDVGTHTIHLRGTYPDLEYTADKTFNITVTQ